MRRARRLAVLALALAASSCERGQYASTPPKRYQGDVVVAVRFMRPDLAAAACRSAAHEQGVTPEFCTVWPGPVIIWPNPCAWPNASDQQQGGCHEIGHVNNWPANHPAE